MIIIFLLFAILLVLILGPGVGLVAGILGATGLALWGLYLIAIPLTMFFLYLIGTVIWCIWWCFDRKAASESLAANLAQREAAKAAKAKA